MFHRETQSKLLKQGIDIFCYNYFQSLRYEFDGLVNEWMKMHLSIDSFIFVNIYKFWYIITQTCILLKVNIYQNAGGKIGSL